jgi:hypothetical protein
MGNSVNTFLNSSESLSLALLSVTIARQRFGVLNLLGCWNRGTMDGGSCGGEIGKAEALKLGAREDPKAA